MLPRVPQWGGYCEPVHSSPCATRRQGQPLASATAQRVGVKDQRGCCLAMWFSKKWKVVSPLTKTMGPQVGGFSSPEEGRWEEGSTYLARTFPELGMQPGLLWWDSGHGGREVSVET